MYTKVSDFAHQVFGNITKITGKAYLFHFTGIYLLSKVSLFIVRIGLLTVLLTEFIDSMN